MTIKKGGKKNKKQKHVSEPGDRKLELKDESDLQEYAQIIKAYGSNRYEANCFDGKTRLAHSRGNLKKKKIYIKVGDVVMISLREFQDEKCDIIYVYNPKEVTQLKKLGEIPLDVAENNTATIVSEDIGIDFEETLDESKDELNIDLI